MSRGPAAELLLQMPWALKTTICSLLKNPSQNEPFVKDSSSSLCTLKVSPALPLTDLGIFKMKQPDVASLGPVCYFFFFSFKDTEKKINQMKDSQWTETLFLSMKVSETILNMENLPESLGILLLCKCRRTFDLLIKATDSTHHTSSSRQEKGQGEIIQTRIKAIQAWRCFSAPQMSSAAPPIQIIY